MPRTARVNTNYNYMGPQPPPFAYNGMSPNMSMPKPLWTYQTTGKFILPDLPTKCDSCGGVLPGGRRLNNLFTRRCRCDGGANYAASYTPVEDDGVYYQWDPNPVQVVELFRPNPLPELPDSFKRLRAADDARKARQLRSRSASRSEQRRVAPVGPAFEEPAITFKVEEARRRLQRVRDSTTAAEPLHPFIDVLLDTLDDVAPDFEPRPRARRSTVVASRPARRAVASNRTQAAAIAPIRDAYGLPSPPSSPPSSPAQTSTSQVPSARVLPPSMPRHPVAEPLYVPGDSSSTSSPEVTHVFTAEQHHQPAARGSTRPPLRGILRNAPGNTGRSEPRQLPTPDATPRQRHTPLHNQASSVEPNANPAGGTATSGTPHSARRMGQPDSRARLQTAATQTSGAPAEAGSFSPPGAFVLQTRTPLVHPRPSHPTSATHFSPLLRAHGSPPRSPVRINEGSGPAPPVHVRYEPTDGPFSVLAPEAVTTSQFSVFGESFWSVSQALAWTKAHRFMHSSEGEREDRIVARARQQEILNLSPFADGFVQDALRLYEETPITPSWEEYETVCADIVTKAKIMGPDSRARDVLLNQTDERDIYWDVNSMTWGRGREKPDGQNAYGRMLMMTRDFIRLRPGSPLIDPTNPLSDLLYGLRG
ncbi:hypothetical protein PENSPDRAFT_755020 [Peniophora sp. CONT]|nr:hypothetical protein PENSPDRAFT_755020 [Peniophora sp. CONT]